MAKLRTAYQSYVGELLKLAGMSDPAGHAERIMALEKKMATVHADLVASQDVHKANNPATIADLKSNAPGLDWADLSRAPPAWTNSRCSSSGSRTRSKVCRPWSRSEPLETWKEWLAFHTINQYAVYLPQAYYDLHFGFYEKTLQGTPKQRDRWKRALASVNADLGDAVG